MRNKNWITKVMPTVMAASLVAGICPVTAFAASGSQVMKDGTYTATEHVVNNPDDENSWTEYDVSVSLTVTDGKFSEITVTPGRTYDSSQNGSYFEKAYTKTNGMKTLLTGQPATEETVNGWNTVSGATCTSRAIKAAALNAVKDAPAVKEDMYVLMNIPYDEYYAADVANEVPVDVFSSATKAKTRTGSLSGGSYHKADGSEITGITFPVKVSGDDLEVLKNCTQITDESSVEITVTNRGNTTTTVYSGSEALFESDTYAYYILDKVPSYYKELEVDKDGNFSFGAITGDYKVTSVPVSSYDVTFRTETTYGDYQLDFDEELIEKYFSHDTDKIYGVIISTEEGSDYGLRHVENIWLGNELAWCTGFTDAVHNCPTDSEHYKAMMGQTISKVTYYTSRGVFSFEFGDNSIYVPKKINNSLSVDTADLAEGRTAINGLDSLPEDYQASFRVAGLTGVEVSENETMIFDTKSAVPGQYTLTVSDQGGSYADILVNFVLTTEKMPAAYNGDDQNPSLQAADGFAAEELSNYITNISSVSVNGTAYPASGRGETTVINKDGTLDTAAKPFENGTVFEITVSSVGYKDLTFTYEKQTGWVYEEASGDWYYYNADGKAATGWIKDGSKWYYLNSSRAMATGWIKDGSKWYYLNSSGAMATGWIKDGGKWYYLNGSGAMATGWIKDGGKWYYLNSSGAMATGWIKDGGKWYYLNGSGAMATGWIKDGGKWYYLNGSGAMATGWIKDGGKWYYLNSSGAMVTGTHKIGNTTYRFNSSGVWIG